MCGKGNGSFGHALFKSVRSMQSLHLPLALRTTTGFANHVGCSTPLTKPAASSFLISSAMNCCLSNACFQTFCLKSCMWADSKVVLDYLLGNTGDIRRLPGKHIDIRPQEGNESAFLFVIECGADGKSTTNAGQPCRDLL